MCVTGAPAGPDGVCVEHGETACVLEVITWELLLVDSS